VGERPVRRDGRAILDQEREAGVRSTAAPVRDAAGLDDVRPALQNAVSAIGKDLACRPR